MTTAAPVSALRRLYLSVYNWVVFFGWMQVLSGATLALLGSGGHEAVYAAVERPLQFAQTAAFLEAQSHIIVTPLILSWSITEIIKYSLFGTRETFGFAPSWLIWLRYSTFLVLMPIGMLSDAAMIVVAMPSMKTSRKYCLMKPNKWNFSFDYRYLAAVILALFVPGFLYMFRYMLARRKKVLSMEKIA